MRVRMRVHLCVCVCVWGWGEQRRMKKKGLMVDSYLASPVQILCVCAPIELDDL